MICSNLENLIYLAVLCKNTYIVIIISFIVHFEIRIISALFFNVKSYFTEVEITDLTNTC